MDKTLNQVIFFILIILFLNCKKAIQNENFVQPIRPTFSISGNYLKEYSFFIKHKYFGSVKFLTYKNASNFDFYLIRDHDVLYEFPKLQNNCSKVNLKVIEYLSEFLLLLIECNENEAIKRNLVIFNSQESNFGKPVYYNLEEDIFNELIKNVTNKIFFETKIKEVILNCQTQNCK